MLPPSNAVFGLVLVFVVNVVLERVDLRILPLGNLGPGGLAGIIIAVGLPAVGYQVAPLFTAGIVFVALFLLLFGIRKASIDGS